MCAITTAAAENTIRACLKGFQATKFNLNLWWIPIKNRAYNVSESKHKLNDSLAAVYWCDSERVYGEKCFNTPAVGVKVPVLNARFGIALCPEREKQNDKITTVLIFN